MNRFAKIVRKALKIFIPLLFGVGIFWYLYRNLDMGEIFSILKSGINYWWVFLSMVIGLVSHILRAYRWRLQINSMGVEASMRNLTNAIFGTYAVNLLFPRLGEVWRCTYISRRESLPFTKVLGSVVSDRLSDTLAVGLITGVVFLLQMPVFVRLLSGYPEVKDKLYDLMTSPWLYAGLIVTGMLVWLIFKKNAENKYIIKIRLIAANLWSGFITVGKMKGKNWFIFYTVLIWICYFLQLYVCFFAFDFCRNLGVMVALTLFVMGSLSVAFPVQGGIGPWHFAVISTMVVYGVDRTEASAFALVAHGAQLVLIVILGLYTMASITLEKRRTPDLVPGGSVAADE